MPVYTRSLDFRCNDLGKKAILVLTFNSDDIPDIYKTVFPTALKVTTFPESGNYNFKFKYKSLLGFTRAQVSRSDSVEPASTYIPVDVGHETTLTKEDDAYHFSKPQSITKDTQIVAENLTGEKQNIGVGFFADTPMDPPLTTLLFKGVGNKSSAQIEFTPVLRCFIVSGYKEGEVLKGPIGTPLFSEDLSQLDEETVWRVTYDNATGEFTIKIKEDKHKKKKKKEKEDL